MTFDDEVIGAIEEMAAHGFSIDEICEVVCYEKCDMDVESQKFLFFKSFQQKQTVYTTYRKGFLQSQLKLRQRIFTDAGHGSSPAQTLAKKIMDDCEFKHNQ